MFWMFHQLSIPLPFFLSWTSLFPEIHIEIRAVNKCSNKKKTCTSLILSQFLEMRKEAHWKPRQTESYCANQPVVNTKEKSLKEIKSATPMNTWKIKKMKQPHCWYGESFRDLDKRSNQSQYFLKPKPTPKQGPSLFNSMKAERSEEATEEKFEVSRGWLMRLRKETISIT